MHLAAKTAKTREHTQIYLVIFERISPCPSLPSSVHTWPPRSLDSLAPPYLPATTIQPAPLTTTQVCHLAPKRPDKAEAHGALGDWLFSFNYFKHDTPKITTMTFYAAILAQPKIDFLGLTARQI